MPTLPLQALLDDAGLNRQHVFNLSQLPADLLAPLGLQPHERQLILFGHAGRRLWQQVQAGGAPGAHPVDPHPIDAHSMRSVQHWLGQALPAARQRMVYPQGLPPGQHIGLQRLGALAGWHHAAPFMVGIDSHWGSWFAYRVVLLTDTDLPATPVQDLGHPCPTCSSQACIRACPAQALDAGHMDLAACQQQRLAEGSACAQACLARQACPVGAEHRYDDSQIRHGAAGSLAVIRRHVALRSGQA